MEAKERKQRLARNILIVVILAMLLSGCAARKVQPITLRPVLDRSEILSTGRVGIKEENCPEGAYHIGVFLPDGQQWVFHNKNLFRSFAVGDCVVIRRFGQQIVIQWDKEQ